MIDYRLGHTIDVMRSMQERSVHCVITSPPYFSHRDYSICPNAQGKSSDLDSSSLAGAGNANPKYKRKHPDNCEECDGSGKIPGLVQVWGGDPSHAHEWVDQGVKVSSPGMDHSNVNALGTRGAQGTNAAKGGERHLGEICQCGAWRGMLGNEPTPALFVRNLVLVCREVRRVLRDDGTFWLNMGDSYSNAGGGASLAQKESGGATTTNSLRIPTVARKPVEGLADGDKLFIPFHLALALQADGWTVRQEIIWAKGRSFEVEEVGPGNIMPEPVNGWRWEQHRLRVGRVGRVGPNPNRGDGGRTASEPWAEWIDCPGCDQCKPNGGLVLRKQAWRPVTTHEYVFLCTKSDEYYGDNEAVREGGTYSDHNLRSVWLINTHPINVKGHYASFPQALVEPMIKVSTSEAGVCPECGAPWARVMSGGWKSTCGHQGKPIPATVLDPFGGSGTTGLTAQAMNRDSILIDANGFYKRLADKRIAPEQTLRAEDFF